MVVVEAGLQSAVKTAAGVFGYGGSVDLPSPNRGAVTGVCYPIPLQIFGKTAAGIRDQGEQGGKRQSHRQRTHHRYQFPQLTFLSLP